ncbi:prenyltransferase [Actinoplanes sp. NBRC 14428]|uniref:DMATS type aromatic prenyltransferase n=1 Tax=Pseudosporangium ferrugineum TaxID=439699 RepID=A0A2T0RHZ1_9ACTN|nr:tryptophan dimethylallyltransferase family protein [Pseudosporangium ferrugineum]PRY20803.1 DMATS type aromatic prenyltransferase [Pseudosporangium ferrugineum]BCJ50620.1 prenyltransferase [Actinoplanes sp. NBRC 14428]
MPIESLVAHVTHQMIRLCEVTHADPAASADLVADLLGSAGNRPLAAGPGWASDIADDHTPIEFSVAFDRDGPPVLRLLAEAGVTDPATPAGLAPALSFVRRQAPRHGLSLERLERVLDLFATDRPQGAFGMWHSLILRSLPEFKVYLNPELHGVARSVPLVHEALDRLGAGAAFRTVREEGLRPGRLGEADRLTFFALDLHDRPTARIKLYVSQHDATLADVARAAAVVPGVDPAEVAGFCELGAGSAGPYDGRPIISSYTFRPGAEQPVGYSVYVPIRSYVADDREAYDRVRELLIRHGFAPDRLAPAVRAVTDRPLEDGVGLIAHVSLRVGPPRPGVSVYLSSEAYAVSSPRSGQGWSGSRVA